MGRILSNSVYAIDYTDAVANHYATDDVLRLLTIAHDIEQNPSPVHRGKKHPNAIKAEDFDWNVFAERVIRMIDEDKETNDPLRKCRMAIGLLNADLSYDNKQKARELLHDIENILVHRDHERKAKERVDQEMTTLIKNSFLPSKVILDNEEFMEKMISIVKPQQQARETAPAEVAPPAQEYRRVLSKEADRYRQLLADSVSKR